MKSDWQDTENHMVTGEQFEEEAAPERDGDLEYDILKQEEVDRERAVENAEALNEVLRDIGSWQ